MRGRPNLNNRRCEVTLKTIGVTKKDSPMSYGNWSRFNEKKEKKEESAAAELHYREAGLADSLDR